MLHLSFAPVVSVLMLLATRSGDAESIIKRLDSTNVDVRESAQEEFLDIARKNPTRILVHQTLLEQWLESNDMAKKELAYTSLRFLGFRLKGRSKMLVPKLISALENPRYWFLASSVLERLDAEAIPGLIEVLKDPKKRNDVKLRAIVCTHRMGQAARPAVAVFEEIIRDSNIPDPFVRIDAAISVLNMDSENTIAVAFLTRELDTKNRAAAALALARSKSCGDKCIGALNEILSDKSTGDVQRRQAIDELGRLGEKANLAHESLRELLRKHKDRPEKKEKYDYDEFLDLALNAAIFSIKPNDAECKEFWRTNQHRIIKYISLPVEDTHPDNMLVALRMIQLLQIPSVRSILERRLENEEYGIVRDTIRKVIVKQKKQ